MLSHELEHVHAVHIGHVEVEDHEGDRPQGDLLDRLEAVGRLDEFRRSSSGRRDARTIFRIVAESSTMRILRIRPEFLRCGRRKRPFHPFGVRFRQKS